MLNLICESGWVNDPEGNGILSGILARASGNGEFVLFSLSGIQRFCSGPHGTVITIAANFSADWAIDYFCSTETMIYIYIIYIYIFFFYIARYL